MSSSRTKLTQVLVILTTLVLIITLGITAAANIFKDRVTQQASGLFSYDIKVGAVIYIFPNSVLLNSVTLVPKEQSGSNETIRIARILLKFSLPELVKRRFFHVPTLIIDQGETSYETLIDLWHSNAHSIISLAQELPKADWKILIKETRVKFTPEEAQPYHSTVDFNFSVTGNHFDGHGAVYNSIDLLPIRINLKGVSLQKGIRITQCSLRHLYTQANFWAELQSGQLQLNGYAFLNKHQPVQSKNFLSKFTKRNSPQSQPQGDSIDIVDLDLKGKFLFPHFNIEKLNFSINNAPVRISGKLSYISSLLLDLSFFWGSAPNRTSNYKGLTLALKGEINRGEFEGVGSLNVAYDKPKDANSGMENITANSKVLKIFNDRHRRLTVRLIKGNVALKSTNNMNVIEFDDLKAFLNWREKRFKIIDVASDMYRGQLQGRVWFDVQQKPMRVTAVALLKKLEANRMAKLAEYFENIHGELNGKLNILSHPNFILNSDLVVTNGRLEDFDFFTWMAETFKMPSLQEVPFSTLAAKYWISPKGNGLSDIDLNSPNVGLTGYFSVDKNNLVSSKVSLSLGREVLGESPKFRAILKMFDRDVPSLPFDFQLSGNPDAMNFLWMQSAFKERIQSRIPNFIERMIDRRIDAILEGSIEEEPAENSSPDETAPQTPPAPSSAQ